MNIFDYADNIYDAIVVNASFALLYILFPLLLFRIARKGRMAETNFYPSSIITLALSFQAFLGAIWSVARPPLPQYMEVIFFGVLLFLFYKNCPPLTPLFQKNAGHIIRNQIWNGQENGLGRVRRTYACLCLLFFWGIIIRIIHPLTSQALGQSDAYSHLNFIDQIVAQGAITTIFYPPGFHWVAALPAILFPIDTYDIVRYGGMFFGGILMLVVWDFFRHCRNKAGALIAVFLIACFPGTYLLAKTSIGLFANQLGLVLLPAFFLHYLFSKNQTGFRSAVPTVLILLGLFVSVPLMTLNAVMLFAVSFAILTLQKKSLPRKFHSPSTVALLIPILIAAGYFLILHQNFFLPSIGLATGQASPETYFVALQLLLNDFFSAKRLGTGNITYNIVLVGLGIFCLLCLWSSWVKRDNFFLLVSLWALLTYVETTTGLLQFSAYQRAGWEFLLCLCLLGGFVFHYYFQKVALWKSTKTAIAGTVTCSIILSLYFFPRHIPVLSRNEDALISIMRMIQCIKNDAIQPTTLKSYKQHISAGLLTFLSPTDTIFIRQISNFTHGDPVATLLKQTNGVKHIPIGIASRMPYPEDNKTTLVILDQCHEDTRVNPDTATSKLQQGQNDIFMSSRNKNCLITNKKIRQWLDGLDKRKWQLINHRYRGLELYQITNNEG